MRDMETVPLAETLYVVIIEQQKSPHSGEGPAAMRSSSSTVGASLDFAMVGETSSQWASPVGADPQFIIHLFRVVGPRQALG